MTLSQAAAHRALLVATLVAPALSSQSPAPGLRLYGGARQAFTQLVDTSGVVVHKFASSFTPSPARGLQLLPDGSLLRAEPTSARNVPFIWAKGRIQRVALDGSILWDYEANGPKHIQHHDIHLMPNGNVLFISYDEFTVAEAPSVGRDAATVSGSFRPDKIVEVQPTGPKSGVIVWEWRVVDHVVQDRDAKLPNYGNVATNPQKIDVHYPLSSSHDFNHINGIDYDPVHDLIVFSAPRQNEIYVIDHSTTTAEARGSSGGRWGKGGDILYRWGNPEAYRQGTANDRILNAQHDPRWLPPSFAGAGNITIFNNTITGKPNQSAVLEIVPPRDASGKFVLAPSGRYGPASPVWTYEDPAFYTVNQGSSERLPNGNTLIASSQQAWCFEVTKAGKIVWSKKDSLSADGPMFYAFYVPQSIFPSAERVSASQGFRVRLEAIAGSARASDTYLMLFSAAGTKPGLQLGAHVLPLNYDGLLDLSLAFANLGPFEKTLGSLDGDGRARASFVMPPFVLGSRLDVQWAFAALDASGAWSWTSNAAPLRIDP